MLERWIEQLGSTQNWGDLVLFLGIVLMFGALVTFWQYANLFDVSSQNSAKKNTEQSFQPMKAWFKKHLDLEGWLEKHPRLKEWLATWAPVLLLMTGVVVFGLGIVIRF